jgi:hypothetical protein
LQYDYFGTQYVTGVVATHVVFALLEKKRLENFREMGEVSYVINYNAHI